MDLGGGSSRKGSRRAHSNRGGHRPGRIISTPRERDPVNKPNNDHPHRYSKDGYSSATPHPVHEEDGSESSRFSTGHNTGDERDDRGRKRKQKQKEEQKRQHISDELAATQRQKHSERECINIDDDNEGTAASTCFDGVRTDMIINPKNENYIASVKEQLGGNDDDDNVKMRQRNKNFRGNNHEKSSMARSLSPKKGRSQRSQRGQQAGYNYASLGGVGRASASQFNDPLDVALEQQTNRPMSSTAPRLHDKFASNKKVVEDVECSPQAVKKRGKAGSVTAAMGGVVQEYEGVINKLWGKGRTKSKQHGATNKLDLWGNNGKTNPKQPFGNADMASSRSRRKKGKECSEAAQQRKDQPMERERGTPWSGEKRKSEHTEWQEDGHLYKKTQLSPKGSQQNAIDVDGSQTKLDQIIHSVDSSSPRKGSNDEEADVLVAINESKMHVNQEDYAHLTTPKPDKGSGLWDRENTKTTLKGMANFGLTKKPGDNGSKGQNSSGKKKVINMHKFLQGTKKNDNIVSSPNSKGGLRDRESSPMANNLSQKIPKKAGLFYGKSGETKSTRTKMIRQGLVLDGEGDEGWFGRLAKSNTPKAKKKAGTKNQRQSKISLTSKTNGTLRRTRSSSRTRNSSKSGGSNNDIITIDSSSDEDEASIGVSDENVEEVNFEESVAEGRGRRRRAAGDRASIDAVRIAVGKKVFNRKCELSLQFGTNNPYLLFSFYDEGKKSEHSVYLRDDELKEVKYFIARDDENEESAADDTVESMTVIAFRITPTDKNNFTKYSRSYNQEDTEDEEKNERRYISVEVRDTDEFQAMLDQMRQHRTLAVWCSGDSEIPFNDLAKYTQALQEDNRKEREKRLVSARRTRSGGNKKKKDSDNELLLVYPFDVDEAILSEAASELKELGGDSLGVESVHAEMHDQSVGGDGSYDKGKSSTRTHYVTIRQDDKERLCPGQFLNDSLVDFWMRWISRGESQLQDSDVHFFTSHFMTTLKDDGPEAVSSWTSKKKINMFKKKLIFVPVNADLHWSLCVIVNPGLIANSFDEDISENEEHSCILFLDSLKMHSKKTYAKHIRIWLNFEWKRLGKGKIRGNDAPFETGKMNLRSPKIPYQENGCDCGVFVCRYAYNLYMMRHLKFTWVDICEKPVLKSLITKGPAFQFDMSDIARIREEIGTLIDNLSKLYLRMKEQEKANKRAKRREIEISKAGKEDASSENASEATRPPSGKEDARSETTTTASDEDGETAEEIMTGAGGGKDEDGDGIMSSFEEKENKSQGNNVHEIAAPEKLASTLQESSSSDIVGQPELIISPTI